MMRYPKSKWIPLALIGFSLLSSGCLDGVNAGVQAGIEDAFSSAIESLVSSALAPIIPSGE